MYFLNINCLPILILCVSVESSHGADEAVKSLLEKFSEEPESEPTLKRILPSIISCFGGGKSVKNSIESLRKEELSSDVSGKF